MTREERRYWRNQHIKLAAIIILKNGELVEVDL